MASRLTELKLNISPTLTAKALGYAPGGLIGSRMLSLIPCGEEGARLPQFDASFRRVVDTKRALRALPKEIDYHISYTDVAFDEQSLALKVDEREVVAARRVNAPDPMALAANGSKDVIMLGSENDIAVLLTTAGNYAANHSETVGAGAAKWDSVTGGVSDVDIIAVIRAKSALVRSKTGKRPNKFACGSVVWDAIQENTKVKSRISYAPDKPDAAVVTEAAFARLIQVDEVAVGDAVYSADGATISGDIWGDSAMLLVHSDLTVIEQPTFGVLAMEEFGQIGNEPVFGFVSTWDHPSGMIHYVAYTAHYKPAVAMNTAGYLWLDTLT